MVAVKTARLMKSFRSIVIRLSVCLSVSMCVCLCVCLSVCVSVCNSGGASVDLSSVKSTDVERGSRGRCKDSSSSDEIVQIYRRDCHEEVYCGSHSYPGRGVYLLKFDNSYSLWRSKTVYYRVFYSK